MSLSLARMARRNFPFSAAYLACLVLSAAACTSPPNVDLYVAELVPFGNSGIDTDVIYPRESGASRFLFRNWPPMQTSTGKTLWLHGSWAYVGFHSVADQPPTFVAEARPYAHPDAPLQILTVLLNGTELETMPMPRRWTTYEIALPAELVKVGWNQIELRFAESYRPADFEPESEDRRSMTAEFRRLEVRGAAGRPYWPDRPTEVVLAPAQAATPVRAATPSSPTPDGVALASDETPAPAAAFAGDPSDLTIEMPADSFFESYLVPTGDSALAGAVSAEFPAGASGHIRAVVDIVEPETSTEVWAADLAPGAAGAEVSADLSRWANRVVGLRLRVFGDANGVVGWKGLGTTGSAPNDPAAISAPPTSGALGRPDVFLIIIDAARADRILGDLGAELAPHIRALAAEGTTFSRVWAAASWTGQSIPALWSGMAPDAVGIEHWGSRLPPEVTTFPELISASGYHTMLWSQHNIYRSRPMLRNGFEVFAEVDSADITQRVMLPPVADMIDDARPTLGVVHLLPPHDPYVPPEPFLGSRSGWYQGVPINAQLLNQFDRLFPSEQTEVRDEIRRAAIAKYEENVRFADDLVGRLIADLQSQGRYDDALVIVTADHGEAFYEHERFLHTSQLFEEFVHVPLVIKWPSSFTDFVPRVDAPVSLIDVAPTLVDGLGIEDARARYQGRSLLPLARGAPVPRRMLYAYTSGETDPDKSPKPKYALLWDDLKLLHDAHQETTAIYRLTDDPGEHLDLSLQEDYYTAWLRQTLLLARAHNAGHLLTIGGSRADDLDEESIRRLRALGYLR